MRKFGKIAGIFAVVFLLAANPVFSSDLLNLGNMQNAVTTFADSMAKALPFYSTVGLNWSDAYIGQLIGAPPHFGFGISAGFTSLKLDAISGILNQMGMGDFSNISSMLPGGLGDMIGFPLPAYTVDLRLGGFGIPFDLGLKFGILDTSKIDVLADMLPGIVFDYMLAGADFRYALIDGGAIPFRLSVGGGFNYLKGGVSALISGASQSINTGSGNTITLNVDPTFGLTWETTVVEAKAQVSFPLAIITPYAGIGASYSWSKAGYFVKANLSSSDQGKLNGLGLSDISNAGFESIQEVSGFNVRAFGGLSLNLFVIRIDATIMYDIFNSALGATVGLRFQL